MAQKKDNRTTTQSDVSDFPLHAFPKKILEMANGLADSESFHIEYLLVSMVSAIASATGNALQIRIKGGWTSSPIFYIILVGRPGLGKTPPLDFAYRPFSLQVICKCSPVLRPVLPVIPTMVSAETTSPLRTATLERWQ